MSTFKQQHPNTARHRAQLADGWTSLCPVKFLSIRTVIDMAFELWNPDERALRDAETDIEQEKAFDKALLDLYSDEWMEHESDDDSNERTEFTSSKTIGEYARSAPFCDQVVSAYKTHAKGRKSTLIFCASLITVDIVTAAFKKAGLDVRSVSSHTPVRQREVILQEFKKGQCPILLNCMLLTEGADMPPVGSQSDLGCCSTGD